MCMSKIIMDWKYWKAPRCKLYNSCKQYLSISKHIFVMKCATKIFKQMVAVEFFLIICYHWFNSTTLSKDLVKVVYVSVLNVAHTQQWNTNKTKLFCDQFSWNTINTKPWQTICIQLQYKVCHNWVWSLMFHFGLPTPFKSFNSPLNFRHSETAFLLNFQDEQMICNEFKVPDERNFKQYVIMFQQQWK